MTSDSPQCRPPGCRGGKPAGSPAVDHTRADRPWARRPKGPPPPNRGPARPVGPGPAKRPREWAGAHPSILPRREKPPTTGGILHRQGMVVGWGSTEMMSEVDLRPDLTHRRRRTSTHIHKQTFPPSCTQTNIHTLAPHVDTQRQRSTISPASQRHTRTSKPYLCVGVMEREK